MLTVSYSPSPVSLSSDTQSPLPPTFWLEYIISETLKDPGLLKFYFMTPLHPPSQPLRKGNLVHRNACTLFSVFPLPAPLT